MPLEAPQEPKDGLRGPPGPKSAVFSGHPSETAEKRRVSTDRIDIRRPSPDDLKHWRKLARRHLRVYHIPTERTPCTVEAMARWLDHLGKSQRWYAVVTATTLEGFIELNPKVSLLEWLGTVLEVIDDTT